MSTIAVPSFVVHLNDFNDEVATAAISCDVFYFTVLLIELVNSEVFGLSADNTKTTAILDMPDMACLSELMFKVQGW